MATYIFSLLGLIALCVFWGVFERWLNKRDPEAAERPVKCGGCNDRCER